MKKSLHAQNLPYFQVPEMVEVWTDMEVLNLFKNQIYFRTEFL
jgi:hypothetical protein